RDIVSSGCGPAPGCHGRARHPGDHVLDGLAAFDIAAAVIEHAVLGERGDVEIGIVEVESEEISRLQVLNCGAILRITANRTSLRIKANRSGRYRHYGHSDERGCSRECQRNCHLSHIDLSFKGEWARV